MGWRSLQSLKRKICGKSPPDEVRNGCSKRIYGMKDNDQEESTENSVSFGDLSILFEVDENWIFGKLKKRWEKGAKQEKRDTSLSNWLRWYWALFWAWIKNGCCWIWWAEDMVVGEGELLGGVCLSWNVTWCRRGVVWWSNRRAMADYTATQVIPPLQPANILTYSRLHSIHCPHLHRTFQPLPYPISPSAFFHLPSVWLSTSQRMFSLPGLASPAHSSNSSLPNQSLGGRELAVSSAASLLGGFGIVALFCSAGVYAWSIYPTLIIYTPSVFASYTLVASQCQLSPPSQNLPCRRSLILHPRFAAENFEIIIVSMNIIIRRTCISFEYASMCPQDGHFSET